MSRYRRCLIPGATYFFTITLSDRSSSLLVDEIDRFRTAYRQVVSRLPVETIAICVMPDHVHAIWTLPIDDADYSKRWNLIKGAFSRGLCAKVDRSPSQSSKREKGIWQRRFWEHHIRDDDDLKRHVDYVHFNPVKHGLVMQANDWPYSSFHRFVKRGLLPDDWGVSVQSKDEDFGE